jgi:hypothetical protein
MIALNTVLSEQRLMAERTDRAIGPPTRNFADVSSKLFHRFLDDPCALDEQRKSQSERIGIICADSDGKLLFLVRLVKPDQASPAAC